MFTTEPRRAGLLLSSALLVVALASIDGCSSDDPSGDGRQSCQSSDDCPLWACTCRDGTSVSIAGCVFDHCQGADACDSACSSSGGVQTVREQPTVKDSPECLAYCAKGASLNCGAEPRCDRSFYCSVDDDECAESKRAQLRCIVDTGKWGCSGSGGWTVTSSCPSPRCQTDAGSD
jgi:hypothetical protein